MVKSFIQSRYAALTIVMTLATSPALAEKVRCTMTMTADGQPVADCRHIIKHEKGLPTDDVLSVEGWGNWNILAGGKGHEIRHLRWRCERDRHFPGSPARKLI